MEIARWIVAFVAVYCFGGILADAVIPSTSKMHLWNPKWPPHAKFHNGQTMLLGAFAGTLSLVILFGVHPLTLPWFFAAVAASGINWLSMLFARMFPDTEWYDPEFAAEISHPFGLNPQQLLSYIHCLLLTIAVFIAIWMH